MAILDLMFWSDSLSGYWCIRRADEKYMNRLLSALTEPAGEISPWGSLVVDPCTSFDQETARWMDSLFSCQSNLNSCTSCLTRSMSWSTTTSLYFDCLGLYAWKIATAKQICSGVLGACTDHNGCTSIADNYACMCWLSLVVVIDDTQSDCDAMKIHVGLSWLLKFSRTPCRSRRNLRPGGLDGSYSHRSCWFLGRRLPLMQP